MRNIFFKKKPKIITLDEFYTQEVSALMFDYLKEIGQFHDKEFINYVGNIYSQRNIESSLKNPSVDIGTPSWFTYYYGINSDSGLKGILIETQSKKNLNFNWISTLYVKEKRKGIGSRLMKHIINKSSDQGKDFVGLGVHKDNTPACKLYERMGFYYGEINNSAKDSIDMWKDL